MEEPSNIWSKNPQSISRKSRVWLNFWFNRLPIDPLNIELTKMAFPYKSKIFPRGLIRRNSPRRFFPRTVLDIQITSYMLIHIIVQLNPKTLFLYNRIFLWIIQGLFPNVDFSHENIFYHKHFGTKILLFPKILYTRWEIILLIFTNSKTFMLYTGALYIVL